VRVNLINSLYTSVFLKKILKKLTLKKKKKFHVNSAIFLHCSHAPLFSEQWSMPPQFTEQCSMVELRAAQESNIFLLSIFLCFACNLLWDPCTVSSFFLLTKRLLRAFLKKRKLQRVAKRILTMAKPHINCIC